MKRFHVHVAVSNLEQSIRFYETLFGAPPTVTKDDYAKWMLDDPRVNFAISARDTNATHGVDHLGIQVDDERELATIDARLKDAEQAVLNQTDAQCCYANSDKAWSTDPSGLSWETFHTHGEITTYGADSVKQVSGGACCAPSPARVEAKAGSSCCA
ncbi:MAG TPA: ArsI/CadI family heavy metal resistance metalloenzyme [Magnetospirillaceae bacterium]|jgi:catechol 2,3-dioxygenase-like lactoylglutathione lyase family enzyme